jgi:hypothetical protein
MSNIPSLQDAIKKLHGCDSMHVQSLSVFERFHGRMVWGTVELFELQGHPKAQRCYAWSHEKDDGGELCMAVLEIPPVDSAQKAVRVAIVTEAKKNT